MTSRGSSHLLVLLACLGGAACASSGGSLPPDAASARPSPPDVAAEDGPPVATDVARDAGAPEAALAAGRAFLFVQSDQRIRTFSVDLATGALREGGALAAEKSPMYLRAAPGGRVLYAAAGDAAAAFAIDAATGALTPLNSVPSAGGPPYIDVHPKGRFAATANWNSGTTILFPIDPDGRLRDGMTAPTGMQSHSARFHPSGRFLYACSVAASQITRFTLDEATGRFTTAVTPMPGLGPRHMAFTPDGRRAYVINERPIQVSMLAVDEQTGALAPMGEVSALRPGAAENKNVAAAEIAVSASGRFVYASVRDFTTPPAPPDADMNVIAVYAVDQATGKLTLLEVVPTGGVSPRGFALAPDDRHLFVAHEVSKELVTFSVDAATGRLTRQGAAVPIGGTSIGIALAQPR